MARYTAAQMRALHRLGAARGPTHEDLRAAAQQRAVAAKEAADAAYWDALTDRQRAAAAQAVAADFKQYCGNCGYNPEDPQHDALLRAWQVDWARRQWPPPAPP